MGKRLKAVNAVRCGSTFSNSYRPICPNCGQASQNTITVFGEMGPQQLFCWGCSNRYEVSFTYEEATPQLPSVSYAAGRSYSLNGNVSVPIPDGYHFQAVGSGDNAGWSYTVPESYPLSANHIEAVPYAFGISAMPISKYPNFHSDLLDGFSAFFIQNGFFDESIYVNKYIRSQRCAFQYQLGHNTEGNLWHKAKGVLYAGDEIYQFHVCFSLGREDVTGSFSDFDAIADEFEEMINRWMDKVVYLGETQLDSEDEDLRTTSYTEADCDEDRAEEDDESEFEIVDDMLKEYHERPGVTRISIPYGVTSIGFGAFWGCESLTSITIPDSVTSIGAYAFRGCESLTSITIPDSVTDIGENIFEGCDNLDVDKAFGLDGSEFEIVDGVLEEYHERPGVTKIAIPRGVTSIGDSAFEGCENLEYITIPDSVTSIGFGAFWDCESLTSITIPDSVTSIGESAFRGCKSLASITIPDSVTGIGESAFEDCKSLTSITIPDSVTSIEESAFEDCESLTSVIILNGVTTIGKSAFRGCKSLTSITIPDSVTSIGFGAFWGCESLTSITIPNGVTAIGETAFRGCKSLTSITIPDSVTSIGKDVFWGCESLASVTTPNGVTDIEENIFESCDNLDVDEAFGLDGSEFEIVDGVLEEYHERPGVTKITIPRGVTSIGDSAFAYCDELISITIPNGVTTIGENAFSGCKSLTSITIPDSVTSIGRFAFEDCESLTSITVPNGVTTIEESTFAGCKSLTSITIPGSVTSIGFGAFQLCESLTSITIPDSVTDIGDSAFRVCKSLKSITIPDGMTDIGDSAFSDCESLTSITIPDSVTNIGEDIFEGCDNLTSIIAPEWFKKD